MFSSIGPGKEQLCVNKSNDGSWCEFFEKRDQAKSTPLNYVSTYFLRQSDKRNFNILFNIGKLPLAASR